MPGRKAKPPRLWFRKAQGWIILDRGKQIRTGLDREQTEGATEALKNYLATHQRLVVGTIDPGSVTVAEIIAAYEEAKLPKQYAAIKQAIEARLPVSSDQRKIVRRHDELIIRLESVNTFFGGKKVANIKAELCRDYVDWCIGASNERNRHLKKRRIISDQTARRHLEDLRAAIGGFHAEHTLGVVPKITLPEKRKGRERWLRRSEAARLLGAALGFVWDGQRNAWKRNVHGRLSDGLCGLWRDDDRSLDLY